MAEPKDTEKKDTQKDAAKPASTKKAANKEAAAKKPAAAKKTDAAAKSAATKKPAAKKEAAPKTEAKADAKPASTKKAAKAAAKKPAAKKAAEAKPKAKAAPKEPAERPVVKAKASYVRIAPRKARLIADQVRGKPLEDALTTLRFSSRGAAQDILKLINSAAANAENNHDLVADDLLVSDIRVDEGPTLRRYRPRALGRATRINKRTSHIQVALTPED